MIYDLEASHQLLGCYLHQDWADEFDSEAAAIEAMIVSEPRTMLVKA